MSACLGIDFDVRCVHCVLLDDDTDEARYVPVPIADKRGSFEAARNVRDAIREAFFIAHRDTWGSSWDDGIWLVGLEDSMYRNAQTLRALARVQGAILASIPRRVCVLPIPAGEWKQLTVGKANASKDEVRAWATEELRVPWPGGGRALPLAWDFQPQDAFDAYCIARACRTLNDRALKEAS